MKIGTAHLTIKIIPNLLTIFRFFSIPIIILNIINDLYYIAFIVFIVSAITDFLDGFIARRYSLTSRSGRIMDALADKLLTLSVAWVLFFTTSQLSLIFIIVITSREIIVSLIRYCRPIFRITASSNIAKWKTFGLYLLLGIALFNNISFSFIQRPSAELQIVTNIMQILVMVLSVSSLINYLISQIGTHADTE